jgi:hypothetical protein
VARRLHILLAVAALCSFLSPLALAAFKGKGELTVFQQPVQPFYDPEYVFPPPAEVASFSLEYLPGPPYTFELKMAVSALECGSFIVGWWVDYSRGWEGAWWSRWFNGPRLVYLNARSTIGGGFKSFGFPLFVSKNGSTVWASTAWVQSIDFYSLDNVNVKCLCTPKIKDVAVEEHGDLGGIVIRVTLHAPASWSTFRLRVYCGNRLVYDFMKRVSIPEKWESSPIDLRADFGPIRLRKAGTYTIQVDVTSDNWVDSRWVTYEKLEPGELRRELEKLKSDYEKLRNDYSALQSSYAKLQGDYERLQSGYYALKSSYDSLATSCSNLQNSYYQLKSELEITRALAIMLGSALAVATIAAIEGWRRARTAARAGGS